MSADFSHAQLLRERGRHEEAVARLLSHLAHQPEDPDAFIELALNRLEIPGQLNLALQDARTATGLMPGNPFPIALQSRILTRLDREKEALELAESSIRLDPEFDFAWTSKSLALIGLSRWKEAEEASRTALALDADNETASNLLAHVLRMQNRLAESEEETNRRLARDPENAFSFANAGWAALQRGDIKDAEAKFKESLRIDPSMTYAKDGLKQSYRARSAFFRLFLKWAFFIQRFNENNRMLIVIGLVVGFRLLRTLAASVHPLLVIPLALAYYLFLFGSWLSSGLANFLLLKDPVARMSLDPEEKVEGAIMGVLFFGGLAGLVAGIAAGIYPLAAVSGAMIIAALPSSMVLTNPSKIGRVVFGLISVTILVLGVASAIGLVGYTSASPLPDQAGTCLGAILFLGVGCTWLGMIPSLQKEKQT